MDSRVAAVRPSSFPSTESTSVATPIASPTARRTGQGRPAELPPRGRAAVFSGSLPAAAQQLVGRDPEDVRERGKGADVGAGDSRFP